MKDEKKDIIMNYYSILSQLVFNNHTVKDSFFREGKADISHVSHPTGNICKSFKIN